MSQEVKERLEQELKNIGWTLKDKGCGHYKPTDPEGRESVWMLWAGRLEHNTPYEGISETAVIDLKHEDSEIRTLDSKDAVSCGNGNYFVLFMNHAKRKVKQ